MKKGDRVKVVKKVDEYGASWVPSMDEFINNGQIHTVSSIPRPGIVSLTGVPWAFAESSLELFDDNHLEIKTVYKLKEMEFDTLVAAKDHQKRLKLADFLQRSGGEETFINHMIKNKQELINILKEV